MFIQFVCIVGRDTCAVAACVVRSFFPGEHMFGVQVFGGPGHGRARPVTVRERTATLAGRGPFVALSRWSGRGN